MKKNNGYTLVQTLVTVAVVGILAAIATYSYQVRVAKSQTAEAMAMMEAVKPQILANLNKYNTCTLDGVNFETTHKYGVLVVSGSASVNAINNPLVLLGTGCKIKYTFNQNNVSKLLQGKVLESELFNNSVLSKTTNSNLNEILIPKSFTALTPDSLPKQTINAESPTVVKDTEALVEPPPSNTGGGSTGGTTGGTTGGSTGGSTGGTTGGSTGGSTGGTTGGSTGGSTGGTTGTVTPPELASGACVGDANNFVIMNYFVVKGYSGWEANGGGLQDNSGYFVLNGALIAEVTQSEDNYGQTLKTSKGYRSGGDLASGMITAWGVSPSYPTNHAIYGSTVQKIQNQGYKTFSAGDGWYIMSICKI